LQQNVLEAEQQLKQAKLGLLKQQRTSSIYTPFQTEIRGGAGFKKKLSTKYLVWDGASSHGAVRVPSSKRMSFWHSLSKKLGMAGVIFLPPRSPQLNPIELVFGHIKHYIRSQCPDEGYTQTSLLNAIHAAFRRITPTMVKHWIQKCGYSFTSDSAAGHANNANNAVDMESKYDDVDDPTQPMYGGRNEKDELLEVAQLLQAERNATTTSSTTNVTSTSTANVCAAGVTTAAKANHIVCMDGHGTVVRRKPKGRKTFVNQRLTKVLESSNSNDADDVVNIIEQIKQHPLTSHVKQTTNNYRVNDTNDSFPQLKPGESRRWSGLGPQPVNADIVEVTPKSVVVQTADESEEKMYEIDGVVDTRQKGAVAEYLIRWKNSSEAYDEWIAEDALQDATGSIKEYWARQR
jgi:transposase